MRLIQFVEENGARRVGATAAGSATVHAVRGVSTVRDLALDAARTGQSLEARVARRIDGPALDVDALEREGRLLAPIDHPDPAHCLVTGTGLSHLGSADARDQMHRKLDAADLTDSMKMFKWGVEGGRPTAGAVGVQPEWFYKGDGAVLVPPGAPLVRPGFARDGGEEPEIVGVYVIGDDGTPWRVGFALGNEFSDHVMERQNYLYLAHSKLRACSIGPELRLGELPGHVEGTSAIRRGGEVIWQKPFLSGEENMCHSIANLEQHHFKYRAFRRPGDVHLHFFGTATLSFVDGVQAQAGDVFEIAAPAFGRPLRNPLAVEDEPPVWPRPL